MTLLSSHFCWWLYFGTCFHLLTFMLTALFYVPVLFSCHVFAGGFVLYLFSSLLMFLLMALFFVPVLLPRFGYVCHMCITFFADGPVLGVYLSVLRHVSLTSHFASVHFTLISCLCHVFTNSMSRFLLMQCHVFYLSPVYVPFFTTPLFMLRFLLIPCLC